MRTRTQLLFLLTLLAATLNLPAITFKELAGVYDCKRFERFPNETRHYNETIVITPDGLLMSLIEVDGIPTLAGSGYIQIDENGNLLTDDGTISTRPKGKITVKGNGHRLEMSFYWPPDGTQYGDVTVTIKGQRTRDRWQDWLVWLEE